MSNPFLDRIALRGKQSKAYWRAPKQEKELAKRLGGHQISRSGAGTKKGDVFISGILRLEAKTTSRASFSITRDMVEKVMAAGTGSGECPAIVVEFLDPVSGKPIFDVAVIPTKALEFLIHENLAQAGKK
ncbi:MULTISPECIES: hypothetical protein [unclassified Bradyrhizobium]|uniref:hypothetical protein n=1 Tax=unclassified Bradyrhizobium TaxID=2631580 RepID=UPI003398CF8F